MAVPTDPAGAASRGFVLGESKPKATFLAPNYLVWVIEGDWGLGIRARKVRHSQAELLLHLPTPEAEISGWRISNLWKVTFLRLSKETLCLFPIHMV